MNKFISSIELIKEYRNIKPFKIELKEGLNIIVGENGIGKSSICGLLQKYISNYEQDRKEASKLIKLEFSKKVKVNIFDTEKMNPRTKSYFEDDIQSQLGAMFSSHGQAMLNIMVSSNNINNEVFIIDEPEAGISLFNQYRLSVYYNKNVISNGNQFIFMTHSLPIISSVEEIYSLDDNKWVSSFVYLNMILSGSKIIIKG